MFRVFQHLLPRALAWRTTVATNLRRYFEGLAAFAADVRTFIDLVYLDLFPSTTRELPQWEFQFAVKSTGTETQRRLRLAGAWSAQGGQSPDYLQSVVHAAGFTSVYVHEWWESTGPFVARDPRLYTTQPLTGAYQCEGSTPWECFDPGPGESLAANCDDSLANDPRYLVNQDLTRRAPPPVPSDSTRWPYFLYFAGRNFPQPAILHADERADLEALLLRICPSQQWIVTLLAIPPFISRLLFQFAADDADTEYEAGTESDVRRIASVPNQGSLGGSSAQATSDARPEATSFPDGRVAHFGESKSITSTVAAVNWTLLHDGTSDCTVALRLRLIEAGGSPAVVLDTQGFGSVGFSVLFDGTDTLSVFVGDGGGLTQFDASPVSIGNTHDLVIVKSADSFEVYLDDMATAADSGTVASPSSDPPDEPLTIGQSSGGTALNAWLSEVLVYEFAATKLQRETISEHLARHSDFEPTLAQYIEYMREDGLAHLFTPDTIADGAWTDWITSETMTVAGSVGTAEGRPAYALAGAQFDQAAELANGAGAFTICLRAKIGDDGGSLDTPPFWGFSHSVGSDYHHMDCSAAPTMHIARNGEVSTDLSGSLGFGTYVHVFRGANDAENLFVVPSGSETRPALDSTSITVDRFRLQVTESGGFSQIGWLALYGRALNEGDRIVLDQLVSREYA